jgi:large subunit ribosomal protein L17
MRHLKSGRKLNRNSSSRKSLFRNLTISLVKHKHIVTTLAKAKELRMIIEPLITRSKVDNVHNRRVVFSRVRNKEAVHLLFTDIADLMKERPGGYVSIIKYGRRSGDDAPMAYVRLMDGIKI